MPVVEAVCLERVFEMDGGSWEEWFVCRGLSRIVFLVVVLEPLHQQNLDAFSVRIVSSILHITLDTEQNKCVFITLLLFRNYCAKYMYVT